MSFFARTTARIRKGEPIPAPLALALSACTPIQRLGMAARKLRAVHNVNARVISFGNITAGGTGKTPAVIERAQAEIAAGHRVAVLTRGYSAPSGNRPADSTDLQGVSAYEALGDEAALILQKVPGVIVVKNANRVAGAQRAIELGCDTLLLDDGYQYLRLARDENIVLIDATNSFGNGHLLPRGILREPVAALARATCIIVTHADAAPDLPALDPHLRAIAPHASIRHTYHAPISVRHLASGERFPLEILRGKEIVVACAIANPDKFVKAVQSLGAIVSKSINAMDHAPVHIALADIRDSVLLTEKDTARLAPPYRENVYALEIDLRDWPGPRMTPAGERKSANS